MSLNKIVALFTRGEAIAPTELLIVQPDGQEVPVMAATAPIRGGDGKVIGATVILTDITSLKEIERMREEWTAVVAHDLRQPVSAILLRADILAAKCEKISPELCGQVEHIHTASERLNRQIGDLMDASRVESNRLNLQLGEVDTQSFLVELLEREARVTEGHEVRLFAPEGIPPLFADAGRLEQILTNLLSNAAKYGDPQSPIDVSVVQEADMVRIEVCNRGPGLTQEQCKHLFERFHRARPGDKEIGGVGLGLYIVRGLVEGHGGEVGVRSTPGESTTFSFTIPLSRQAAQAAERDSRAEGRETRVQRRESKVESRESIADRRDSRADSRENAADIRETQADVREERADRRDFRPSGQVSRNDTPDADHRGQQP